MVSGDPCPDLHIVITGPMGAGKTTVGREVARRLDRPFCDSDDQIRLAHGMDASTMAAERGVERLHAAEAAALDSALESPSPVVVAAAASIADRPGVGRVLDGALAVLLDGRPGVLAARAEGGRHRRPLSEEAYRVLVERRRARLSDHVDVTVDVTYIPPGEVVGRVLEHCRRLNV